MPTEKQNGGVISPGTEITVEEAQARIGHFQEAILGLSDYPENVSKTKACLIHLGELLSMLSEGGISGIRAYLALRWDPTLEQNIISLVMVKTRLTAAGIHEDIINEVDPTKSGIFDFTAPCPNTCSPGSPLNF